MMSEAEQAPEPVVELISVVECAGCHVLLPEGDAAPVTHLESCTCLEANGGSGWVETQIRQQYYTVDGKRVDDAEGSAALAAQEQRWYEQAQQMAQPAS
jgi:hypothetical protein